MKIVLVSDRERAGGAGIATTRLATALSKAGHDVQRLVWRADTNNAITVGPPLLIPMRYRTGRMSRETQRLFHTAAERSLARTLERLRPDVINIHNLHNAIVGGWSDDFVSVCRRFAPVVWTLHEMWSFTGRCVHSGSCERYLTLCDHECPTAREYPAWPAEHIAEEYRSRASALASASAAVSPSNWLAGRAQRGLWRGHRVVVIRNGVDLAVFRPLEKRRERRVLLAVAHDFLGAWKGMHRIASLASRFSEVTWVAMGKNAEKLRWGSADVRFLGHVDDEAQKVEAFASADALVHISSEDNLPNTVVEALACGTPVIALDRGGVAEVVRPGVSGWLTADEACFEETLRSALHDLDRDDLRASSRALAEAELGVEQQVSDYERLFRSLVAS